MTIRINMNSRWVMYLLVVLVYNKIDHWQPQPIQSAPAIPMCSTFKISGLTIPILCTSFWTRSLIYPRSHTNLLRYTGCYILEYIAWGMLDYLGIMQRFTHILLSTCDVNLLRFMELINISFHTSIGIMIYPPAITPNSLQSLFYYHGPLPPYSLVRGQTSEIFQIHTSAPSPRARALYASDSRYRSNTDPGP